MTIVYIPSCRCQISTSITSFQASQQDDSLKTADALVSVTIEDVNDNAPEFDKASYSVAILENSQKDTVVFRVTITDLDKVGTVA